MLTLLQCTVSTPSMRSCDTDNDGLTTISTVAGVHGVDDTLAEGPHATQAEIYMFAFLQTDFRLVVTNAKIFNPPGTIYHTEADRLEIWGLDHIAKASAHVIEYETDWNIDVEQDEDAALIIDEDDDLVTASTPREIEGSQVAPSPAPSSVPQQYIKRGPRGPYKKGTSMGISEGIDAEGRLPGSKDGVGAFPPGSDWAEMMVALKIKGIVS
jgi:bromodomain-containing protein 7/9